MAGASPPAAASRARNAAAAATARRAAAARAGRGAARPRSNGTSRVSEPAHGPSLAPSHELLVQEVRARLAAAGKDVTIGTVAIALRGLAREHGATWDAAGLHAVATTVCDELSGVGPLGPLLRDPTVAEVMVNAHDEVYVERAGRIERTTARFRSAADVAHLIERVVSPLGLRVDPSSPWVDARMPDGSRFHAVVPPIAIRGPTVTIRKFERELWTLENLVERGAATEADACLLAEAIRERRNVLVSGGAGSGKTTLLGVLARLVPGQERVITIEDAAELRLGSRHVVALETRPPNVEGRGEVAMRDLVRCAMRMRPDRIVVGEVRGPEALDMLQALNTGHSGSMATIHANTPRDALVRLEALALLAAPGLSVAAARRQVASAIELVVHMTRTAEGHRCVGEIAEVRLGEDGPVVHRVPRPLRAAEPG